MIIEQYGVTLKRLTIDDAELVRRWRNTSDIRLTMNFQKHITKEMQIEWFHSINNKYNYYFLIIYNDEKIGVINAKNISESEFTGEGGIFVWNMEKEYEIAPVYASLCILNVVFKTLNFFKKSIIQVRRDNLRAIYYNTMLGYKVVDELSTPDVLFFELTKEEYLTSTEKINKIAQKITGDYNSPRIKGTYSDDLYLGIFKEVLSHS